MTADLDIENYKRLVVNDFNSRPDYDQKSPFHGALANRLVELAQLQPGQQVLDVATGTGLVAIAAIYRRLSSISAVNYSYANLN